jgi:hypothetical protein
MSIGSINFGPESWQIGPAITLRDEIAIRIFAEFAAIALEKNWTREECAADAYEWADALLKHKGGAA